MVLTANTLPWVGSVFRSTCTAFSPTSLAFGVHGFTSPATPLSVLHPAGGIGCNLLASTDAILQLLPNAGTVVHPFAIPLTHAH